MSTLRMESLAAEHEILLLCARTVLDEAGTRRLCSLVGSAFDWESLVAAADRHGVAPLLNLHLPGVAPRALSEAFLFALRKRCEEIQFRNLHLTGVLVRLHRRLEQEGIPAVSYKGPTLAQALYGNLALRPFVDLDLLVRHADLPRVRDAMLREGFSPDAPFVIGQGVASNTAGQFTFHDAEGSALVEFHSEKTLRHFPRPLQPGWLLERHELVSVSGHHLPTLPAGKLLIAVCVHGAKDFWDKLKWVCDVAEFLRVHSQHDWQETWQEATALGCDRMLALGLALARNLLDAPLPDVCAQRVQADPPATRLAKEIAGRMLAPRECTAPERLFLRRRMCMSAAEGWRYALRLATSPAEEDWTGSRLPGSWSFLHALRRPFRLLRKYGLR